MRGQKNRRKQHLHGTSQTEGIPLVWELLSQPQKHPDFGYTGARISVQVADAARRELIIEFPFPTGKDGQRLPLPQRPKFTQGEIDHAIAQAVEAGWDPGTRGKAFAFKLPEPLE
jgi:hypothetical protein